MNESANPFTQKREPEVIFKNICGARKGGKNSMELMIVGGNWLIDGILPQGYETRRAAPKRWERKVSLGGWGANTVIGKKSS